MIAFSSIPCSREPSPYQPKINNLFLSILAIAWIAFLAIGITQVVAQETDDSSEYPRGLILDSPEDLKDITRAPTYRAFVPERVDLSRLFPTPGNQGRHGSCVGWAVGYATRAYY